MLIKDVIKANEALKDLSDAQISAIETLSKNEEVSVLNSEIAAKTKELHSAYDADIKEILGLERPAGKKTYKWLKEDILPLCDSKKIRRTRKYIEKSFPVDSEKITEEVRDRLEKSAEYEKRRLTSKAMFWTKFWTWIRKNIFGIRNRKSNPLDGKDHIEPDFLFKKYNLDVMLKAISRDGDHIARKVNRKSNRKLYWKRHKSTFKNRFGK